MSAVHVASFPSRVVYASNLGRITVLLLLVSAVQAQVERQIERVDLYIDSGRPVAEAIESLAQRYPTVITYEDPRYEYRDEIKDVTEAVRNPLNQRARTSGHRVLVPSGGSLQLSYDAFVDTGEPVDLVGTLQRILEANESRASGGRFRILESGKVFHVVPMEIRDVNGVWVRQASVLDTRITLSAQNLQGDQMLNAIVDAITDSTGIEIGLGLDSINLYAKYQGRLEASNEIARDVLLRTLHSISDRLTWRLLYGPDVKSYGLNVRAIPGPRVPID